MVGRRETYSHLFVTLLKIKVQTSLSFPFRVFGFLSLAPGWPRAEVQRSDRSVTPQCWHCKPRIEKEKWCFVSATRCLSVVLTTIHHPPPLKKRHNEEQKQINWCLRGCKWTIWQITTVDWIIAGLFCNEKVIFFYFMLESMYLVVWSS